jgi:hypothetical protein
MLFIVERATSVVQWLFVVYLLVVGVNMYKLFSPPQCSASDPAKMCVPSAVGVGDKYDLWVWASPEENFHAIADYVKGGDYAQKTVHASRLPGSALDDPRNARAAAGEGEGEPTDRASPVAFVHAVFGIRLNETVVENVTVPVNAFETRKNGTLYAHVVVYYPTRKSAVGALYDARKNGWRPSEPPLATFASTFTKRLPKSSREYSLLLGDFASDDAPNALPETSANGVDGSADRAETCAVSDARGGSCVVDGFSTAEDVSGATETSAKNRKLDLAPHVRPRLTIFSVSRPPTFDRRKGMPTDLPLKLVRAPAASSEKGHIMAYAPLLMADDVTVPRREYVELSPDANRPDPVIELKVVPMHVGLFRLTHQMTSSLRLMSESFGMTESDLDDVKELFTGHDWRWMAATFVVSLLHSWFAFLAFKHDIGFWKKKSNLEGLSVRSQWSTFICQAIIFANLLDTNQASTIILVEMGASVAIEFWKVSKFLARDGFFYRAFKIGPAPREMTQTQRDTDEYDKRAMRVLSFCLYPVVFVYGGYSLLYHPQRSWRSWILRTLANGVYMFGFIAMTPQLYVNYRLKSVAHMPWRAFMYKTFNTFIDDVFAFAVTMPFIHRLACLRDDLVFFVYLYQRRIYPVDKKRVNEFGRAYEEDDEDGETRAEDEKKRLGDDDATPTKETTGTKKPTRESKKKR